MRTSNDNIANPLKRLFVAGLVTVSIATTIVPDPVFARGPNGGPGRGEISNKPAFPPSSSRGSATNCTVKRYQCGAQPNTFRFDPNFRERMVVETCTTLRLVGCFFGYCIYRRSIERTAWSEPCDLIYQQNRN